MADTSASPPPSNPYAAPRASVEQAESAASQLGEFLPGGRTVPAGHGWWWLKRGWRIFRTQPWLWIGVAFTFFVISIGIQILPVIGMIASIFLTALLAAGIAVGAHEIDAGRRMRFADLFAGFSRNTKTLLILGAIQLIALLGILLIVYLVSGDSSMFGGMRRGGPYSRGQMPDPGLFIGPLVMLALFAPYMAAVWFAPALVVFNDLSAPAALAASFKASVRNWLPFLVYGLGALLITLPFMILFGLLVGGVAASAFGGGGGMGLIFFMMALLIPLGVLFFVCVAPIAFASIYVGYRDIFYRDIAGRDSGSTTPR
jgi:hypothetical protein